MPSVIDSVTEPLGVVVLAGGAATRFPGKLRADAGGVTLLERVVRNVAPAATELIVAAGADVDAELGSRFGLRFVADRVAGHGPLGGLLSTLPQFHARWVFAVAGDAPFVDAAVITTLLRERRDGDEAIVPAHGSGDRRRTEPLAALYEREAFLREGQAVFDLGRGALKAVLERLRVRYVEFAAGERLFANINTAADYADFQGRL